MITPVPYTHIPDGGWFVTYSAFRIGSWHIWQRETFEKDWVFTREGELGQPRVNSGPFSADMVLYLITEQQADVLLMIAHHAGAKWIEHFQHMIAPQQTTVPNERVR